MPTPSTHIRPGRGPTTLSGEHRSDPWQPWSQAWTTQAVTLTGRPEVTVLVAPGAGGSAPACSWPDLGRIEVDATLIGSPDVANPRRAGHKKAVPAAYGALVHEAAHTAHSRWSTPPGTPPVVAEAADLLEEFRAERNHRLRRRADRRWLRRAVTTLVTPGDVPVDDAWHAGVLAALLLARADAGTITARDTRGARAAVTAVIGRRRLAQLRDVWRAAHATDDTDGATMVELGRRWCEILGIDPDLHPTVPVPDPGLFAGLLAAAVVGYLAAADGLSPTQWLSKHIAGRHGAPATWTRREPTGEERRAAATLAARLAAARTHHPETGRRPAPVPPGRLRTRTAITADAQRAAGTMPTVTPWQQRAPQPPEKPDLHLAVLIDVSGSMGAFAAPMSSAGWILAHAAHRNHATVTTIAFGDAVTLVVPPRHRPAHVLEMTAHDGTEKFIDAVKLADHLLDLRSPRTLRLLTVVSDGHFVEDDHPAVQRLLTTLHRGGCPVLWLHPHEHSITYPDTTAITVTDPVTAIRHIADTAVRAIEQA